MTATDKVALNIFLACPTIKKQIFKEFEGEVLDRNYVELLELSITPNEKSQRSSLLYPPAFELKTSEADLSHLSGVFRKSERKNINFRPFYINPINSEYMFYQDSHWYIGFPEKRLRSKASDLSLVPLIDWEYLQDDGQWRDLKEVNTDQNILHTFTLNLTINHDFVGDNVQLTNTKKMIQTQQMRTYDELRELDIEETPESLRSFLLFPLSLNIPGKGLFRKLIGENKTHNDRPVYNHTETGEVIFFKGDLWRSCGGCNYLEDGTDIGAVKSKSWSLMVPRLPFQEWEGFNAGESAQQMTGASRAWPGLTLLSLADIKTAACLVENNHLTHLERIIFPTDLHTKSVNTEVQTIKRVAGTVSTMSDYQIFAKPVQGLIIFGGNTYSSKKKVELYNPSSGNSCRVEDFQEGRYYHTSCSGLLCGGWDSSRSSSSPSIRSCEKITGTEVSPLPSLTLRQRRRYHLCWSLPGPGDNIMLLGGDYSPNTTEIVSGSSSSEGFALPYKTDSACGIEVGDHYVVTGGNDLSAPERTLSSVANYSQSGLVEYLPSLNQRRSSHACSSFISDIGETVLLVTGGGHWPVVMTWTRLDSTEILVTPGGSWRTLTTAKLPSPRNGLRAGTANNVVYIFGGYEGSSSGLNSILSFNKTEESWQPAGQMTVERGYHTVEKIEDIGKLCP